MVKDLNDCIIQGICITHFRTGCEKKVVARGLCKEHYAIASRAVRLGQITWERLESRHKALPRVYKDHKKEWLND